MAGVNLAPIRTGRLTLRIVETGDGEAFTRLVTPEISRWTASWLVPFMPDMAERKVAASRKLAADGATLPFVITRTMDGETLGWVSIYRKKDDPLRSVLGYWLGEVFLRQGIIAEAAEAAVTGGFERLGFEVIEASVHPANAASASVLRKLGFTPTYTGLIWAETRQAHELCQFHERKRTTP